MDPNQTLRELRDLVETIKYERGQNVNSFYDILDLWSALDQWITRGGSLPENWNREASES